VNAQHAKSSVGKAVLAEYPKSEIREVPFIGALTGEVRNRACLAN